MELTDLEHQTLLLFANQGPLTGYDLHSKKNNKGTGEKASSNIMSNAYWEKIKNKLLKHRLITESPEEGRRKPYILSVDGFDYVIRILLPGITDFDRFVEIYQKYFPLVFGVWDMLREYDLDNYIKSTLSRKVEVIYLGLYKDLALRRIAGYSHQEFIEDLYMQIYLPELFNGDDELDAMVLGKISEFRKNVPEVKAFVERYLGEQKKGLRERLDKIELLEKSLL